MHNGGPTVVNDNYHDAVDELTALSCPDYPRMSTASASAKGRAGVLTTGKLKQLPSNKRSDLWVNCH